MRDKRCGLGLAGVVSLLPLLFSTVSAQPRVALSGRVFDGASGQPLRNANVFLAGSFLGSATNDRGYFRITGVPEGQYQLVVSVIGFAPHKQTVRVRRGRNLHFVVSLQPAVLRVPDIVVQTLDQETWEKTFALFRRYFLSTSVNAAACRVLNPGVLELSNKGKTVGAWATDILIIENRALGYRLHYLLESFELTAGQLRYTGEARFQELEPADDAERQRWRENRRKTYYGSLRHFLAALATGRVAEEGFLVSRLPELGERVYHADLQEVDVATLVSPGVQPYERQVRFFDYLQVIYTRAFEPGEYVYWRVNYDRSALRLNTRRREEAMRPQAQTSWLAMNKTFAVVDTSGYVYDPMAFTVYGYWAWQGVADLLPMEYRPR